MSMTKSNDWIFSNTQLKILIIFADDARKIFVSNIRPSRGVTLSAHALYHVVTPTAVSL